MSAKIRTDDEETRIVWDAVYEEYKCVKCGAYLHYMLGFKYCPYCRRKIAGGRHV